MYHMHHTLRPPPTPQVLSGDDLCLAPSIGVYAFQGFTASGAPYFRDDGSRWLFYDPDCRGNGNAGDSQWKISLREPSLSLTSNLDGVDPPCGIFRDCGYKSTTEQSYPPAGTWRFNCHATLQGFRNVELTVGELLPPAMPSPPTSPPPPSSPPALPSPPAVPPAAPIFPAVRITLKLKIHEEAMATIQYVFLLALGS